MIGIDKEISYIVMCVYETISILIDHYFIKKFRSKNGQPQDHI